MGARDVTTEQTAAKPEHADDRSAPLTTAGKARASSGDRTPPPKRAARPSFAAPTHANGDGGPAAKRAVTGPKRSNASGGPAAGRASNGAEPSDGNGSSATNGSASGARRSGGSGTATPPATRRAIGTDELVALVEVSQRTVEQPQTRRPALAKRAQAKPVAAAPVAAAPVAAAPVPAAPVPAAPVGAAPGSGPGSPAGLGRGPGDPREDPGNAFETPRDGLSARAHAVVDRPRPPRPLPPERRAKLLAAIARSAEELAHAEVAPPAARRTGRRGKVARRVIAFGALLVPPAAVTALLMSHAAGSGLSRVDAGFISGQVVTADQRLRLQLTRVAANGTAPSAERAREASLTLRSLMIEVGDSDGAEATLLRRALTLERAWIDAVGSTLANPRSGLGDELLARDAAARAAIAALPGPSGGRSGGARSLLSYARLRVRATSADTP